MNLEAKIEQHVQNKARYCENETTYPRRDRSHYSVTWKGKTYKSDDTRDLVVQIARDEGLKLDPVVDHVPKESDETIKPIYLDVRQAAKLTGLAVSSLNNYRRLHRGPPYVKIGEAVRYNKRDVLAYIKTHHKKQRNNVTRW